MLPAAVHLLQQDIYGTAVGRFCSRICRCCRWLLLLILLCILVVNRHRPSIHWRVCLTIHPSIHPTGINRPGTTVRHHRPASSVRVTGRLSVCTVNSPPPSSQASAPIRPVHRCLGPSVHHPSSSDIAPGNHHPHNFCPSSTDSVSRLPPPPSIQPGSVCLGLNHHWVVTSTIRHWTVWSRQAGRQVRSSRQVLSSRRQVQLSSFFIVLALRSSQAELSLSGQCCC